MPDDTQAAIDRRLARLDRRLDEVDRRVESLERRGEAQQAELAAKIEALETTLDVALDRIANYWKRDAGQCTTRARMDSRLQNHEWRMKQLEKKQ